MSGKGEMTVPRNYCLHVSPLHAKSVIITDTDVKGRLTWRNGNCTKHGLAGIGLHAEQAMEADVSGEFLKPFRLQHVAYSGFDVAHPTWSCLDLRRRLGRIVTLMEWPTSPFAE